MGDDPNPTSISNLTALNLEGFSFDSKMPAHVAKPDYSKNKEFNKRLVKHTLHRVYGVDSIHDINYKRKLNRMVIAIGTHRVNDGTQSGIKFIDPETKKEVNTFDFISKFVETPETKYVERTREEQIARNRYLWNKLRLVMRTKGFM